MRTRMTRRLCLALLGALLAGCAGKGAVECPVDHSKGIPKETAQASAPVAGYADLLITATLKTHLPGAFSVPDLHGTPCYQLALEIDGKKVELYAEREEETRRATGVRDPEAGEGVLYRFANRVRLRQGKHLVTATIPADGISVSREIVLPEKGAATLELEPVYGADPAAQHPGSRGATTFLQGVRQLRMKLNGKEI